MPVLPNFAIQSQGNAGNLCWACVGMGIATFYDTLSGQSPRWEQLCQYVMAVFDAHDGTSPASLLCCDPGRLTQPMCNQPFWLPDALAVTKNQANVVDAPLDFVEVKKQIDLQCPVGIEIETSVGFHVIVISGYDEADGQKVLVADPAPDALGNSLIDYNELLNDYRHAGGQWTQSYLSVPTQP